MDFLLYLFTSYVMLCHVKNGRTGMKQFRALNFEKFRMGKGGGGEFLLRSRLFGEGHFTRFRCLHGEWVRKEASGMVIYSMCVGGGIPSVWASLSAD